MQKPIAALTVITAVIAPLLMTSLPGSSGARAASLSSSTPWVAGNPTFTAPARRPANTGVVYHGMWDDMTDTVRANVLDQYAAAGVKWVRMDVAWKALQPTNKSTYDLGWGVPQIEKRLNELASRGMQAVVMFYWAPTWSSGTTSKAGIPRDYNDYANALAWAASRWKDKVAAWEMWNEPDQTRFWAGADPVKFAALLKAAYPKAKAANPAATFIAGAPTYVNTDWYRKLYAAGARGNYDGLGIHPYVAPSDQGPQLPDDGSSWRMHHIAGLVSLMAANGESTKTIWATEFGWSAHSNVGDESNWDKGVTEAKQASYLLEAIQVLASYPQVKGAFWFNDWDSNLGDLHEDRFGLISRNLAPKPGYYALKCASSGFCGPNPTSSPASSPTSTPSQTPTPTPSPTPSGSALPLGIVVAAGSPWLFNDAGTDLGTTWRAPGYDDIKWSRGNSPLGYGETNQTTAVAKNRLTYYFRKTFNAGSTISKVAGLRLRALIDDGAVVYLNGSEIWRDNLPTGTITATTRASAYVAGPAEHTWRTIDLPKTFLVTGTNTLAVEVHNDQPTSSDIAVNLELSTR